MNIFLLGLLAKRGENALRALRVQERNHEVLCAFAWSLVNELDTGCFALCKTISYVVYVESDVVHTAAAAVLLDELGNGGLRAGRLQKLDLYLANLEESRTDLLILYDLNTVTLVSCKELKEGSSLFDRGYCNTQMLNVCGFHNKKLLLLVIKSVHCAYMRKHQTGRKVTKKK